MSTETKQVVCIDPDLFNRVIEHILEQPYRQVGPLFKDLEGAARVMEVPAEDGPQSVEVAETPSE
jgi:hypothetical protein